MDVSLAWRNLWRNPRRSILTILAISFCSGLMIFSVSMQEGSYDTMIQSAVRTRTGHLQVQAEGYFEDHAMRKVVHNPKLVGSVLDATPGVANWTPRATGFALISSDERTYGGLVTGINPSREANISTLKSTLRRGEYLDDPQAYEALVGSLLAKNLRVDVGGEIVILGQGRDGSVAATVLTVKGITQSGQDELDRAGLYMPLAPFQETFSMRDSVHEMAILVHHLNDVESVRTAITASLPQQAQRALTTLTWDELNPGLKQTIEMDIGGNIIFYTLLVIVVAFSIWNTFLMAVFERTREFGVLLAVGALPGRLTRVLLLESLALTLSGICLGLILGISVTAWFEAHGIHVGEAAGMLAQYGMPERIHPKLTALSMSIGPLSVFLITTLSALYPAFRVHKFTPVQAMQAT